MKNETTSKVSCEATNDFCPQTMFLYGTKKEDGTPNFGLFCWFSYYWDKELCVMACIGGSKLTLDRIHEEKVFSANLVNEELLPLADYFGTANGYKEGKMEVPFDWEMGQKLPVPVLTKSPVCFELEVAEFLPKDGGEILLCKVKNVLMNKELVDDNTSIEERIVKIAPVSTTCATYFGWDGRALGKWHEPAKKIR